MVLADGPPNPPLAVGSSRNTCVPAGSVTRICGARVVPGWVMRNVTTSPLVSTYEKLSTSPAGVTPPVVVDTNPTCRQDAEAFWAAAAVSFWPMVVLASPSSTAVPPSSGPVGVVSVRPSRYGPGEVPVPNGRTAT